jgi:hypothetical protein
LGLGLGLGSFPTAASPSPSQLPHSLSHAQGTSLPLYICPRQPGRRKNLAADPNAISLFLRFRLTSSVFSCIPSLLLLIIIIIIIIINIVATTIFLLLLLPPPL